MANGFYTYFPNNIQTGVTTRPDIETDTLKLVLTDHGTDTPVLATDDFYNDINTATVGSLSSALGSKTVGTVGQGVFDAGDMTPAFTAVSGNSAESLSLLKDTGRASRRHRRSRWSGRYPGPR